MTIDNNISSIIRHISKLSDNQLETLSRAIDKETSNRSRKAFKELKNTYKRDENGKIVKK